MQYERWEYEMYPQLDYEDVVAYSRDVRPVSPADWARELIGRTGLDPERATDEDLAVAVRAACAHRAIAYQETLESLTLADLHQGAAEHLAERAEASRRWEQRRRRYPRARQVIAQQRRYVSALRGRQRQHEQRSVVLRGDHQDRLPVAVATFDRSRPRSGRSRRRQHAITRTSSRAGDSGDGDSGPGEPPPAGAREREHHPLDDRHVATSQHRSPAPSAEGRRS